jgi:uncharacterized protein YijF (DUF1287 family)
MRGAALALIGALFVGAYRARYDDAPPPRQAEPRADLALAFDVTMPASMTVAGLALAPPGHGEEDRLTPDQERAVVGRARQEVERAVRYDADYWRLNAYPGGDLPPDRGACSDLVVRALRAIDVDLQVLVHEDVLLERASYAPLEVGDANIDHRRVPALWVYFVRKALALPVDVRAVASFRPGDVVFYAWTRCPQGWPCAPAHVAIVSDRIGPRGLPMILQNGGPQAVESDSLDAPKLVGHYRLTTAQVATP